MVLPPDPLGDSPTYEEWSRGGLARRCDGIVCVEPTRTPDGVEFCEFACRCTAAEALTCKPTTRLSVLLRDIPFGGTWRVESHGWGAFHELPGMVGLIERLQSSGLAKAYLGVRPETKAIAGQTNNWVEPYLRLDESVAEIAAGAAQLRSLGTAAPTPALEAGSTDDDLVAEVEVAELGATNGSEAGGGPPDIDDDEVVDAELVDDELPELSDDEQRGIMHQREHGSFPPGFVITADVLEYMRQTGIVASEARAGREAAQETPPASTGESAADKRARRLKRLTMLSKETAELLQTGDQPVRHGLARKLGAESGKITDLDDDDVERAISALERVMKGEVALRFDETGLVKLVRPGAAA